MSILNIAETTSILVRKRNDARIPDLLFKQSFANFNAEIVNNHDVYTTIVDNILVNSSLAFILNHNINATDAIILRSALDLQRTLRDAGDTLLFCAADRRLLRAAGSEGLSVLNPEDATAADVQQLLDVAPES